MTFNRELGFGANNIMTMRRLMVVGVLAFFCVPASGKTCFVQG